MVDLRNDPALSESIFSIPKMDCPSEENLIRMAFGKITGVRRLTFDLGARELKVVHSCSTDAILGCLLPLKLGATLLQTAPFVAPADGGHFLSRFSIPKMDCPSEENLIRMALGKLDSIQSLKFDLPNRQLEVAHGGDAGPILEKLMPLNLGASLLGTAPAPSAAHLTPQAGADDASEAATLRLLLTINAIMFFVEIVLGMMAQSTGLIADSLDMFADAAVYGLALYAVGRAASLKTKAAHVAGWLQMVLAVGALVEVLRRFLYGSEPVSALMMGVGLLALAANVTCLVLISRKRDAGAHMKASYIFSANDVIANAGVIAAGALVAWTGSPYPDLVIGTVIGVVVLNGARRILQLR
ncbi:MAG TPA: cation transporter [Noviherbaspirillum sp.]|nr:cation transporter [Noviherbaspirillum sp.]